MFDGKQYSSVIGERKERFLSTDAGGVVEFYLSKHLMTRVDLGDTIIRYGEIDVPGYSEWRHPKNRPKRDTISIYCWYRIKILVEKVDRSTLRSSRDKEAVSAVTMWPGANCAGLGLEIVWGGKPHLCEFVMFFHEFLNHRFVFFRFERAS